MPGRRSLSRRVLRTQIGAMLAVLALSVVAQPVAAGAAPYLVKDIDLSGSSNPTELTAVGETLFFSAKGGGKGRELWMSDGTESGTRRVKDIRPGSGGSTPTELTAFAGKLLFTADDGSTGRDLWMSDGTSSGTHLVMDINPGAATSGVAFLTVVKDRLFFFARSGEGRLELWKTNGTPEGTNRVKQFLLGATVDAEPAAFQGRLYFGLDLCGGDVCSSEGLWRSDGTATGTKQFYFVADDIYPAQITRTTTRLYWTDSNGLHRSDGTKSGTSLLSNLRAYALTGVDNRLYFGATAENGDAVLWVTPGGPAESDPNQLFRFEPGTVGSLADVGGRLYLSGVWINPPALWRSNGTPETTDAVQGADPDQANPWLITDVGGVAYFAALDKWATCKDPCNEELWRSNGTDAGTFRIANIRAGAASSSPRSLTNVAGTLYFTANDGTHGRELWRYVP